MSNPSSSRGRLTYSSAPVTALAIGVLFLAAFIRGGHPGLGWVSLGIMLAFTGVLLASSRRSETVRGLLNRRDERIVGIDLRATAFTAGVMIVAVLVGFVVEIAHGRSGRPFDLIGAAGGVSYLAAVVYYRLRR